MEVSKVSFRVQVKLDFKSLGQFLLYHYYTQVSGLFSLLLSVLALVFAIWRWPVLTVQGKCVLILIALMFTVLQPLMILMRGKRQLQSEDFQDSFSYLFNESGVSISQGDRSQQFPWEDIKKIRYRKDAVYVYMTSVQAFVLPREQCGKRFDELVAYMKEKKK